MCAVLVRSGRPGVAEGLSRIRMGSLVDVDHPGASEPNCVASVPGPLASSKTRYSQVSERSTYLLVADEHRLRHVCM